MPRYVTCAGICGRSRPISTTTSAAEVMCRDCRKLLGRPCGKPKAKPTPCPECAAPFVSVSMGRRGRTTTCSKACAQRHRRVKICACGAVATSRRRCAACNADYDLERAAARRARIAGGRVEPYRRADIFARDDWRCQLCDGDVNPEVVYPHPLSATIDHVVAIALGGADAPDNVQLAHFRCNVVKGVRAA